MKINGMLEVAQLEILGSDPALTPSGRVYWNSADNLVHYYNASSWRRFIDTDVSGNTVGLPGDLAVSSGSVSGLMQIQANMAGIEIANAGTQTYALSTATNGLLLVNDITDGYMCLLLLSGTSTVTIVSDPASKFSTSLGTSSKINIAFSSSTLSVQNEITGTKTVKVAYLKMS